MKFVEYIELLLDIIQLCATQLYIYLQVLWISTCIGPKFSIYLANFALKKGLNKGKNDPKSYPKMLKMILGPSLTFSRKIQDLVSDQSVDPQPPD